MELNAAGFVISLVTTVLAVGISIGVYQSKVLSLEKDINNLSRRTDGQFKELKENFIPLYGERLSQAEAKQQEQAVSMGRIEERLKHIQEKLDSGLEKISEKLERLV